MVIWARLGILGLLIPVGFILIAQTATAPLPVADRKPVKRDTSADDAADTAPVEDPNELKAAEQKRAADREKAVKRGKDRGFAIGCLMAAVVLWPLGRWMNQAESRSLVDQQTGQPVELQAGGGHTLFFIPMEYWSIIWGGIGLFKLFG